MPITFKSAADADLIMHEKNGKEILALLGKPPEDTCGIITVEQLPKAIAILQNAVLADKARPPQQDDETSDDPAAERIISFAQRALPFIAMLERAAKKGEPVIWGV